MIIIDLFMENKATFGFIFFGLISTLLLFIYLKSVNVTQEVHALFGSVLAPIMGALFVIIAISAFFYTATKLSTKIAQQNNKNTTSISIVDKSTKQETPNVKTADNLDDKKTQTSKDNLNSIDLKAQTVKTTAFEPIKISNRVVVLGGWGN